VVFIPDALICRHCLASTEEERSVPTINANTGIVTQINVFTVPEGGQQRLIDFLQEAAKFASATPGWLSASVHRSRDGTRVVNYAQSENLEAAQRIIDRLREGGWLEGNEALGEAHPGLYDVVFTLEI
jgi:Antibiotic biosynthesis monooxygenase